MEEMDKAKLILIAVVVVLVGLLIQECQRPPEVKTVIEYQTKTDTITKTKIIPGDIRYVQLTKTVKGRDSIVYVEKPSENDSITIEAREFKTTLEADSARADLSILSTGQVLGVSGSITWQEKKTTKYIETFRPRLYLYGETSVNPVLEKAELGLDYSMKKYIIGVSAEHIFGIEETFFNVKVGVKLF